MATDYNFHFIAKQECKFSAGIRAIYSNLYIIEHGRLRSNFK